MSRNKFHGLALYLYCILSCGNASARPLDSSCDGGREGEGATAARRTQLLHKPHPAHHPRGLQAPFAFKARAPDEL
eukprot:5893268-Alexandrium_andersonii.AAC.1